MTRSTRAANDAVAELSPDDGGSSASRLDDDIVAHLRHLAVERRVAARTLVVYREAFVKLQRLADAHPVALREVQPQHVRRWAAGLHRQGLQSRSIAVVLSAWRGLYRVLGQQGRVALNPVDGVRAPKAAKPLPKALPVDQAVALAEHGARAVVDETHHRGAVGGADARRSGPALQARDHCIVELLYGCGLRVAELAGLDVTAGGVDAGWVDAADATVHVFGKGGKWRSVPVGPPALGALAHWLTLRGAVANPDEPALFVSRHGARLTTSQVRTRLASAALRAGLPTHVHPHMLRHSYASHLLQSSGDLRGVQELLGHASIVSTQVYTRLDFGHLSQVYDAAHPRAKLGDDGAA